MQLKNIFIIAVLFIVNPFQTVAQNQLPVVTNVTFIQRPDATLIVDIYYDVNDPDGDAMTVTMQVSSDNGTTWDFPCESVSGDTGYGVTSGLQKHIEWNFAAEHPQTFGDQFKIKIIADDSGVVMGVPCPGIPTVTYEGKTYNTVQIGGQCWLKENLDVGTRIDGSQNATDDGVVEKYCYDDNPANCETYGGLYQWNEAMQYVTNEGAQCICPVGWHLPTYSEFQALATAVNNDGNALKSIGQGTGTNNSGFSALLAGDRGYSGDFGSLGSIAYFWSSTEYSATVAYGLGLYGDDSGIFFTYGDKVIGFSIRCIKDETPIVQSCPGIPTVTYEGKTYNTVQIGEQCWLKENLDVGVMIDSTMNQTNNSIIEKYCYNDNPSNCATYGGLYQWDEAMQYVTNEGVQGICPAGWHIPTYAEFQTLKAAVNSDGNALKAIGQGIGGGAGTNTSGFSALLAGYRINPGTFGKLGSNAYFWGSTENFTYGANALTLYNNDNYINEHLRYTKVCGFSVRCLKD